MLFRYKKYKNYQGAGADENSSRLPVVHITRYDKLQCKK
jgi:hypothetical protein